MELLPLHIEYLLSRHDCVIVPGFGAFIATETEAYIDFEAGVIRPRRREISFNSSVVTDDGLLSHSIARREGMAYEDARRILSGLIEKLAADLNDEGEVSLGMIGRLVKDSEARISFQPRKSAAYTDIMQDLHLAERSAASSSPAEAVAPDEEQASEEQGMCTFGVQGDRYVFTITKRAVRRTVEAAAMLVMVLTIGLSLLWPVNLDNEQKASVISIEDFFHHEVRTEALRQSEDSSVRMEKTDSLEAEKSLSTPAEE